MHSMTPEEFQDDVIRVLLFEHVKQQFINDRPLGTTPIPMKVIEQYAEAAWDAYRMHRIRTIMPYFEESRHVRDVAVPRSVKRHVTRPAKPVAPKKTKKPPRKRD
jgi:hypothetical protein